MLVRNRAIKKKRKYVMQLAKECGAKDSNNKQWYNVYLITQNEQAMDFFIDTQPYWRLCFIETFRVGN